MQALIRCSSGQVMWDVDAICWWADQVNFRVSRVLHLAQATESRNNESSNATLQVSLLTLDVQRVVVSKDNTGLSTTL